MRYTFLLYSDPADFADMTQEEPTPVVLDRFTLTSS